MCQIYEKLMSYSVNNKVYLPVTQWQTPAWPDLCKRLNQFHEKITTIAPLLRVLHRPLALMQESSEMVIIWKICWIHVYTWGFSWKNICFLDSIEQCFKHSRGYFQIQFYQSNYCTKHCNCPEFEWLVWQLFLWETNVCLKDLQRISIIWMTSKYPQEAKEKVASNFYAIVVTLSCLKDNWWVLHWGLNTCPNFFFCKKSPEWFCSIFTNKFLSICWQTTWIAEMKKNGWESKHGKNNKNMVW